MLSARTSVCAHVEATMNALFPAATIWTLRDEELTVATRLFSSVALLAYVLGKVETLAVEAGLDGSLASEVCRYLPLELDVVGSITGYDFSQVHGMCNTPLGIVAAMTSALEESGFEAHLGRLFVLDSVDSK